MKTLLVQHTQFRGFPTILLPSNFLFWNGNTFLLCSPKKHCNYCANKVLAAMFYWIWGILFNMFVLHNFEVWSFGRHISLIKRLINFCMVIVSRVFALHWFREVRFVQSVKMINIRNSLSSLPIQLFVAQYRIFFKEIKILPDYRVLPKLSHSYTPCVFRGEIYFLLFEKNIWALNM